MKRNFDSLNVSVASGILMDRIFNGWVIKKIFYRRNY
jgi:hypothetical protein